MAVTTFILGAGASKPYGFPIASELRTAICNAPPVFIDRMWEGDKMMTQMAKEQSKRIATALRASGQASIDAWLAQQPQHAEWGKTAIAMHLLPVEARCLASDTEDWYSWFFRRYQVKGGLNFANVRVVTFNYDRSLEMFLVQACMNSFGMTLDQAVSHVGQLPLVHVYGTFAAPALQSHFTNRVRLHLEVFVEASKGILTMNDEREAADRAVATARKFIDEARHVVFLGFGFDEANLARIGAHRARAAWVMRKGQVDCLGSAYGMLEGERMLARMRIGIEPKFGIPTYGCYELLRSAVTWED
ncbi:MAG TPA: hypothetical protein VD997_08605 [Phycisphaerales bacterium]|nr:hypothetical protein [Phycisphaerales bacterium]